MSVTSKYIREKLEWLEVQEKQTGVVINNLKTKSKQVNSHSETAMQQVVECTHELIAAINQSKNKLLQDVERLKKTLLARVNQQKVFQESRIKDLQKTRDNLNKLYKTSSGECSEEMVHIVLNKSHVLQTNNKQVRLDPTIRFDRNEGAVELPHLDIGTVNIIEEADCSKCFIEATQSELEALSNVKLCLHTNTTEGKPCIVLEHMVQVEVWPAKKHVDKLTILEGPVGSVHLSFLPQISGKFVISVKIDDKEVKNSPFPMTIRPRRLNINREIDLTEAGLKCPCGIAVSQKFTKIAVSDSESHCLAIFNNNGAFIRKIGKAGTSKGRLSYPDGLAFLNDCEVVVADRDNHRVQIFNADTGSYVRNIGKTTRLKKQFKSPWGVSVDNKGQIIVSDTYNSRVQIFHARSGDLVKEYSFAQYGDLFLPSRTLSYKDLVIVADALGNNLHIIDQNDGPIIAIEISGGRESVIKSLNGIALDLDGNIAVCDQDGGSVKLFTREGHFIAKTEAKMSPVDLVSLPDGSFLVVDENSGKLLVIN